MAVGWRGLDRFERETLMALAAMHAEFGPDSAFTSDAVGHVMGRACVAELGFLALYGLAELTPDRGYLLTGEGFAALPPGDDRRALAEHREEADQGLREEQ